jgi:hypothetical protein
MTPEPSDFFNLAGWFRTPHGKSFAAGFDYWTGILNDSEDQVERQQAREALKRLMQRAPDNRLVHAVLCGGIEIAEQRKL